MPSKKAYDDAILRISCPLGTDSGLLTLIIDVNAVLMPAEDKALLLVRQRKRGPALKLLVMSRYSFKLDTGQSF